MSTLYFSPDPGAFMKTILLHVVYFLCVCRVDSSVLLLVVVPGTVNNTTILVPAPPPPVDHHHHGRMKRKTHHRPFHLFRTPRMNRIVTTMMIRTIHESRQCKSEVNRTSTSSRAGRAGILSLNQKRQKGRPKPFSLLFRRRRRKTEHIEHPTYSTVPLCIFGSIL